MSETLEGFRPKDKHAFQGLNRFYYKTAVSRIEYQVSVRASTVLFRHAHCLIIYDLVSHKWRVYEDSLYRDPFFS